MQERRAYLGKGLIKVLVTWVFECYIFVKADNNETLYIPENEDDRKNAMFGEHYHTSCISNRLDQRQMRAKEMPVSLLM